MHGQAAIIGRIALAALLGYAIGWEREARHASAGERTFALVALGAAASMALATGQLARGVGAVFTGVGAGVGFLGAGIIFRQTGASRGLTSAASLFATAAIGLLVGAGSYLAAIFATALAVVILELDHIPFIRAAESTRLAATIAKHTKATLHATRVAVRPVTEGPEATLTEPGSIRIPSFQFVCSAGCRLWARNPEGRIPNANRSSASR